MNEEETLEQAAERIAGVEGWTPWIFEAVVGGIICTGAVCPLITRGKRKGEPNYRKADMTTYRKVIVPARAAK